MKSSSSCAGAPCLALSSSWHASNSRSLRYLLYDSGLISGPIIGPHMYEGQPVGRPSVIPRATLLLAQLPDRGQLRGEHRDLALHGRELLLALRIALRIFRALERLLRLGLVEVVRADRSVREHRHDLGLHFEHTARDEDELLLAAVGRLDAHLARLDAGDERRVLRIDPE